MLYTMDEFDEVLACARSRLAREKRSFRHIAIAADISETNLYNLRDGRRLKPALLEKLLPVLGLEIKYRLGGKGRWLES